MVYWSEQSACPVFRHCRQNLVSTVVAILVRAKCVRWEDGDSADMCAGKFPLMSMEARAEGLACADLGARTPIGVSGNFYLCNTFTQYCTCDFKFESDFQ